MTKICRALLLAALPLTLATPALAQDGAARNARFGGVPRIGSSDGWSIKPRGRVQVDTAYVSRPDGVTAAGTGAAIGLRRAQLGVEGTAPNGFSYLFEAELAEGIVEITEATVTWKPSGSLGLTVGQHNNFQALDELTSERFGGFLERAAFTDAFNFERRLGVSTEITRGPFTAQFGLFGDNFLEIDDDVEPHAIDGRVIYAPQWNGTRLHLAASAHWLDIDNIAATGATVRYRQRPLTNITDIRFISTRPLAVENETRYGLEAAVISGPFHAVAEAQWLDADVAAPNDDVSFFGGYAEIGWFLTGESRGYRGGRWDRTRVRRGGAIEEGGSGAFQVNLRYDRLDLDAGGEQNAYAASFVWIPTDYVRFIINYVRIAYDDAAIPAAGGLRDYTVDVLGARAQIDF